MSATPDLDKALEAADRAIDQAMRVGPTLREWLAAALLEQRAEEAELPAQGSVCACHAGFKDRGLRDPACFHCSDAREMRERAADLRRQAGEGSASK